MPILEVQSLTRRFGGLTAVDGLSFAVEEGEIRGLIGPNGAGKTTTFNVISGFYAPSGGRVVYDGRDISGNKTSEIAHLGLVRTFQGTTLFHEMTCRENALIGCHLQAESPFFARVFGRDGAVQRHAEETAMECLAFFGLDQLAGELAMNLPHGLQRALGMAVALAAQPKVLLLDEPFTGMNPEETRHMMGLIEKVRDKGVTLLLVEHDMQAVMGLCNRITVMNFGSLLAEGSPEEIQSNPEVIKAYLGGIEEKAKPMLLEVKDAVVHYNKVMALKGVSLKVPDSGIVTILGANGAGKTTTLRAISGLRKLTSGEIHFDGERIDGWTPEKIVGAGLAHVPEGRRVFPDLTVLENLYTGAFLRRDKAGVAQDLETVFNHFPRLRERREQSGKTLSGGEQQMLAIGRALMAKPRLLLLDEPSMGLAPVMVEEITRIIVDISKRGVPVVLVEQNAELALRLARYAYVLETGAMALEGEAAELHENDHVRRAYLGG